MSDPHDDQIPSTPKPQEERDRELDEGFDPDVDPVPDPDERI